MAGKVAKINEGVVFDLDAAERDPKDIKEPFAFVLQGRTIQMHDPATKDWRDVILMTNPAQLFRIAMSDEDYRFFIEQEIEGWRVTRLMESYDKHFGLQDQVRKARQQQRLEESAI